MSDPSEVSLITEIVLRERASRDLAQWESMRTTFASDSYVHLSWFTGTGPSFVEASQLMYERGSRAFHSLGPVSVEIAGDKALAHEGSTVHLRGSLAGVEIDVASHGRLFQRLVKRDDTWFITSLTMLYYKDVVAPVGPSTDLTELADYAFPIDRPYKYLAALLKEAGYTIGANLPATDRPELCSDYLEHHTTWLHS